MRVLLIGRNERIEYRNVGCITDEYKEIRLQYDPVKEDWIEILSDSHLIGTADEVVIPKSSFVMNEIYIDPEYNQELYREMKTHLNAAYGSLIYADTDSLKEDPKNE
jgi:hypothetical protein